MDKPQKPWETLCEAGAGEKLLHIQRSTPSSMILGSAVVQGPTLQSHPAIGEDRRRETEGDKQQVGTGRGTKHWCPGGREVQALVQSLGEL